MGFFKDMATAFKEGYKEGYEENVIQPTANNAGVSNLNEERLAIIDKFIEDDAKIYMYSAGSNKVRIIKLVREYLNCDLREAKELVDSCDGDNVIYFEGEDKVALYELYANLQAEGAEVEIASEEEAEDSDENRDNDDSEVRFCPMCGNKVNKGDRFCIACGKSLL